MSKSCQRKCVRICFLSQGVSLWLERVLILLCEHRNRETSHTNWIKAGTNRNFFEWEMGIRRGRESAKERVQFAKSLFTDSIKIKFCQSRNKTKRVDWIWFSTSKSRIDDRKSTGTREQPTNRQIKREGDQPKGTCKMRLLFDQTNSPKTMRKHIEFVVQLCTKCLPLLLHCSSISTDFWKWIFGSSDGRKCARENVHWFCTNTT